MRLLFILLCTLLLGFMVACDTTESIYEETTIETILTPPDVAVGEAADVWYINGQTYMSEPEAWDAIEKAASTSSGKCWHWTRIDGRWYARTCGLSLSEQCYTPCGPYGTMCDCTGPGGPGGNW